MKNIISYETFKSKLIEVDNQLVLLDKDVAALYGFEKKVLNQALKRNIEKFSSDYVFELTKKNFENLRSQNVTTNLNMIRVLPKVFTEKGLYMVATILKSSRAIEIETKIELNLGIYKKTKTTKQKGNSK